MIYQMIREKSGFHLPLFFAEFVDLFIDDSSYDSREVPEAFCGINAMERASMFLDFFLMYIVQLFRWQRWKKGIPIPSAVWRMPNAKVQAITWDVQLSFPTENNQNDHPFEMEPADSCPNFQSTTSSRLELAFSE